MGGSIEHLRHEKQAVFLGGCVGHICRALVRFRDAIFAQALCHVGNYVEWVRERRYAFGIDCLQLVDQAKNAVKLRLQCADIGVRDGNSRQMRDALEIVRGEFHANGELPNGIRADRTDISSEKKRGFAAKLPAIDMLLRN